MYRSGILGLTILAPRGAPCALEGERCSGYIGTPWPRRGPRRTKWLVSLAQPRGGCRCSLGRLAHRCVSGPPRNLQRCLLFFLSLAPSLALFGLLYLILSSVRQPLPKRSGGAATTGQAPSCRGPCWLFSRALFSCRVHEQPFFGGCSYDLPEREDAESPALSPCSCACPKIPRPSMLSLSRRGRRPRSSLSTMPTLPPLRSQSGPPHGATHPNRLCVTTS